MRGCDANPPRFPAVGKVAAVPPNSAQQVHDRDATTLMPGVWSGDLPLRVSGDRMSGESIRDRGWTAYRPPDTCENGGDAVVLIPDEDGATLKELHRQGQGVELRSANPQFVPRHSVEAVQAQGCHLAPFGCSAASRPGGAETSRSGSHAGGCVWTGPCFVITSGRAPWGVHGCPRRAAPGGPCQRESPAVGRHARPTRDCGPVPLPGVARRGA